MAAEYRARYEGRPDLDGDFTAHEPVEAGQEHTDPDGGTWRIDRIEPGTDALPDTIVFVPIP